MVLNGNENFTVFRSSTDIQISRLNAETVTGGTANLKSVIASSLDSATGVVAPNTIIGHTVGDLDATLNVFYLLNSAAGGAITLPAVTVGGSITFLTTVAQTTGSDWVIGCTGDDTFAIGSNVQVSSLAAIGSKLGTVCDLNYVTYTIAGDTNGGGGIGTKITVSGMKDVDGTPRWYLCGTAMNQGTGAALNASAFA